jgi:type II secretion system (T2SS) protein E
MARLGQLLVRADLVSENNLARALGIQGFAGGRLGTLLLERGSIDEDSLGKTLALQHGCEYIPWRVLADVPLVVIAALPAKFAIKHAAVPFERGESHLKLALRDPGDLRILDELFFVTGRKIIAGVAPEVRIYQALEKYYGERRTPRYTILAEKLSRPIRPARASANAPPPPPEFFPGPPRKPAPAPAPQEVWGDSVEPDTAQPAIVQSWKMPDLQVGGWAGIVSPGMDAAPPAEPETISWEEMPAPPSMWIPESQAPPPSEAAPPAASSSIPEIQARAVTSRATPQREAEVRPVFAPPTPAAAVPLPSEPQPLPPAPPPPVLAAAAEVAQAPAPRVLDALPAVPPAPATPLPAKPREPEVPFVSAAEAEPEAPPPPAREPLAPLAPVRVAPSPPPAAVQEAAELAPAEAAATLAPPPAPTAAPASLLAMPSAGDFPEVVAATDRDSIATAALMALGRRFVRAAVFVAKPDAVTAWGGAGKGVSPEELRDIRIPWTEPSVFLNVRLSRAFYLGPLPPLPRHEAIAIAMGRWPDECLIQPIMIKEKPVAFLYAEFSRDQGATPMDLAYMRELAGAASTAFVSSIRLKKKEI